MRNFTGDSGVLADAVDYLVEGDQQRYVAGDNLGQHKFIPGADLISTFDPSSKAAVIDILGVQKPLVCPKAPYAACMTAPCTQKKGENPVCSCPVFNGVFQLPTPGAVCDPGDNLIPSASFTPADIPPP
jgi:hypothetical protein